MNSCRAVEFLQTDLGSRSVAALEKKCLSRWVVVVVLSVGCCSDLPGLMVYTTSSREGGKEEQMFC